MSRIKRLAAGGAALLLMAGLIGVNAPVGAQSTPEAGVIETPIVDATGATVGAMYVSEGEAGVTFTVLVDAGTLAAGEHGIHIHETGSCDPAGETTFQLAGGHFDPTGMQHGAPGTDASHAGDLGNLTAGADGSAMFSISTMRVTLETGEETSLIDADGSALVIHEGTDDLVTDPSGESGGRLLCAVIASASSATAEASPAA